MILGLLGPIACFVPGTAPPLEADTDTDTDAAETEDTEATGDPAEDTGASTGEAQSQDDLCEKYCEVIGDHCEEDLAQYPGQAICEAVCGLMDLGDEGDLLGNSATCRANHALLAAEVADPHCRHAGPTGDTTCGGPCESFCSLSAEACPGELSPFSTIDDCIAECEGWNPEPEYFANVEDSDTYACRMHHLTLAALAPETHCEHIGTDSPVCQDLAGG